MEEGKVSADIVLKEFLRVPEHFSSIVNAVVYGGQGVSKICWSQCQRMLLHYL